MAEPGDVVTVDVFGATGVKRRPAVVLSSGLYHRYRPDLILGVLTTNTIAATAPTDYVLLDWQAANLRAASAFRAYSGMAVPANFRSVGKLSARDWQAVRERVLLSLG
jgi:mRNA interferase MazF